MLVTYGHVDGNEGLKVLPEVLLLPLSLIHTSWLPATPLSPEEYMTVTPMSPSYNYPRIMCGF